jgi:hypothetical protein
VGWGVPEEEALEGLMGWKECLETVKFEQLYRGSLRVRHLERPAFF